MYLFLEALDVASRSPLVGFLLQQRVGDTIDRSTLVTSRTGNAAWAEEGNTINSYTGNSEGA